LKKENSNLIILHTNDDGPYSDGLIAIRKVLQKFARVVTIVPHQEMSGSSHSLTFTRPLRLKEIEKDFYILNGTPADCAYVGMFHILKNNSPNIVVSGLNNGYNMGEDVFYSGTVAGAMEGFFHGKKGVAVSVKGFDNLNSVVSHFEKLFEKIMRLDKPLMLNVNYPEGEIKGEKITVLSNRMYPGNIEICKDPRNADTLWIGGIPPVWTDKKNSDIVEVKSGFVSITPLKNDLTNNEQLGYLKDKLK
jgi:5'-nucleotidase